MRETEFIVSTVPAPAGLMAVYKPTPGGYTQEHSEPVAAIALIQTDRFTHDTREIVAMVIDQELGTLSPAHEASDFDRLEWAKAPCKCKA